MFEEVNVTLRKGQGRVNGWRQRWREIRGEFFFFIPPRIKTESAEEREKEKKKSIVFCLSD